MDARPRDYNSFGFALLITLLFWRKASLLVVALFLFNLWFFRNPDRSPREELTELSIVSPADGKVVDVQSDRISIFLSPVDVHVNWTPIAGIIDHITYTKGKFLPAFNPESSRKNEQNEIGITNDRGQQVLVRQVAGTVARRIVCWVQEEELVPRGHKFGMIKLGSRVDMIFPKGTEIAVKQGQRLYGGETIIGSLPWEK